MTTSDTLVTRLPATGRRRARVLAAGAGCVVAAAAWVLWPRALFDEPLSRVVLDCEGQLLGAAVARDEQWRFAPVDTVPERLARAMICFEDHRFRIHPGVDPLALARAIRANVAAGRVVSGASTITMQVIRLSRHNRPRTVGEKLVEMVLALRLDLTTSKNRILALYATNAPFGGNVVGIDAASWRYFGCEPCRLSWAESALLAVLPNAPALIHPGRHRARLKAKRDALLDRLCRTGAIDSLTRDLAVCEPIPPRPLAIPMHAPHLFARIDAGGGRDATVRTTLDRQTQLRATETVRRHHRRLADGGINNLAAIIARVGTGEVLAYVGNVPDLADGLHGNHIDIITRPRSTGSILKPFLFASMLDDGELLPSQLVPDIPVRLGGFAPENYSRGYDGAVPACEALARSLNVPAVHMLRAYGVDRFCAGLKGFGLTTLNRSAADYGLSLILGGAEGSLWDIAGAYAGMARTVNNFFARDSADETGPSISFTVLPRGPLRSRRTDVPFPVGPGACYLTLQALLEVERPGEENAWREYASARKIAWKTGTSYGFRDGWAVGVTPDYAIGVWAGNADGEGRPELTGLMAAAPVLFDLFDLVPTGHWFSRPEMDLALVPVCARSGHRPGPDCASTRTAWVPRRALETGPCPYCRIVHCDASGEWRVQSDCYDVAAMVLRPWFVLPPAMEWYYRRVHAEYRPLPRFAPRCAPRGTDPGSEALSILRPSASAAVYVPVELDGRKGRVVFEAAHRQPAATLFWHLDSRYLGATAGIHQMACDPAPGAHILTVTDEAGETATRRFQVLARG